MSAVAATFFAACSQPHKQSQQPVSVLTDTVRVATGHAQVHFPGKIKAAHDVSLSFRVSGAISSYRVPEGRLVKAGDVLVEMDPADYQVQLSATEAEYAQIKAQADRVVKLHADGVVADVDNDKAVYGLQQIEAKLKHHRDQLSYTRILAPFDGMIQKKLFAEGEIVGAGMPVVQFISSGSLEVEINIPTQEYIRRSQYGNAYATVDVAQGQMFELQTISISPKANANQLHTMRLRIVNGNPSFLVPGMNTNVTITIQSEDSGLLSVPGSAVFATSGKPTVYLLQPENNTVKRCEVTLHKLLSNGQRLISSPQINAGDIVISAGVNHIVDGQHVRPIAPASSTNIGGLL